MTQVSLLFPRSLSAGFSRWLLPALSLVWLLLASVGVQAQALSGTYTINSASPTAGTNFTSFSAAATALNTRGVNAAVTFNVSGGPYTEQLLLNTITGASATNRVTFNGNGRTIQFGSNTSTQRGVITLDGAKFVTVDSLNVDATGGATAGTYGWGIHLVNNADNNIIRHCDVTTNMSSTSTNFAGIVSSASTTSATGSGAGANQNVTIERNRVTGGYYGITAVGNTTASPSAGNSIRNNRVRDFYFYGIYNLYQSGVQVIGNDVARPTRTTVSAFYGIYLSTGTRGARVERNRIHQAFAGVATSTSAAYCIYVTTGTAATATTPNEIVNNLIYDIDGNGLVYAIYNPGSSYTRYYYNTINVDDQSNTSTSVTYGFYNTTGTNVEFRNNIVRITRSGTGDKVPIYLSSATGSTVSNYNNLTGSGTGFVTGRYIGTDYPTLADWQTANSGAYDQNSVDADPQFVSASTGNLRPTAAALNNVAQPLTSVPDDFTGATRGTTPDIGAYEFTPAANDVAVVSLTSPVAPVAAGARTVTVQIRNNGTTPLTSVALSYALNGGTAVPQTFTIPALASGATTTLTFTVPATLINGLNTLVISASLPNGVVDPTPGNNTITRSFFTALPGGPYTINNLQPTAGSNFTSFTDAATALNSGGITGAATFSVLNGPYTEQFILNEIPGTSATSRIVINGNGRTIQFGSNDSNQRAVVALNGADYVTLDSLRVDATIGGTSTSTYGFGIHLYNGANNNIIRRCVVTTDASSTSSNFAGIASTATSTGATGSGAGANENVTIECNTVTGGYYSITAVGNSTASPSAGSSIRNNQVRDFYFYGIYTLYQDGVQIISNDVARPTRATVSTFYGIYLSTGSRGARVEKNRVHQAFSASATNANAVYAIYVATSTSATTAMPNDVINNLIYDLDGNGTVYGIYNPGSSNVRFYHNTISIDDQTNTSTNLTYGFYHTTGLGVEFKNNIVRITRSGTGLKYAVYFSSATGNNIQSNYNDLYGTGTSFNTGYYLTAYATLANWQAAFSNAFDQNSIAADPVFVNLTAGNLVPSNVLLNNAAQPLARVTDDFTGAARGPLPDIGAYEFTPVPIDVSSVSLVGPGVNQSCYGAAEPIIVQIRNSGTAVLNFATNPATVTVVVTLPGGTTQTFTTTVNTGTLASGATQNVTLTGTLNMTALGTYSFAVTSTVVGDLNASNNVLSPAPTRTVTNPVAGTLSPASSTLCVSGTAALNLTGSANGSIQYQSSTSATGTFTDVAGAVSAAYTTPVLTTTRYYRAKVSCNGREVFSNVATVTVNNPVILTAPAATTCAGGTAQLLATAGGGGTVKYYTSATGGTALTSSTTGGPFTTPALTTTTTYYAAAVAGSSEMVGPQTNTAVGTAGGALNITYGLIFTVLSPTTLTGVYVYPGQAGVANIELQNSAGTVIGTPYQATFTAADVNVKTFVPLGFQLPAGVGLRLMLNSVGTTTTLYRNTSGPVYPYTSPSGNVSITDNTFGAGYYYYFYDWQIGSECAGTRTPLTVTVTPGLVATLPQGAATICGATPYTLNGAIAGTANGLTYTSTGTGTFSPNATTLNATYTPSPADITAGTVTITATPTGPAAACTSTATVVLTIQTPPNASFSYPAPTNPSTTYCLGSGTVAPVLAAGATAGTFSTTGAGLRIDPVTGVINLATSSQPGTFTIVNTVAGTGVCNGFTSTATITLNFGAPAPGTPVATAQANGTVVLSVANPLLSVTYQFYRNGVAVGAATATGTLTLTGNNQSGQYTVVAISAAGCQSAPSAAVTATVTGTRATAGGLSLLVAPNPTANGQVQVTLSGANASSSGLVLLNALGQVVYSSQLSAGTNALDLHQLAAGVYVLRVQTPAGVLTERLVRE